MGVSLREPSDGDTGEVSDINVTPFIDVILVLLIIFMVAAPLSTVDVAVDLPTSNAPQQARPDAPIYLTVKSNLDFALGDKVVDRGTLQARLDRETAGDRTKRIFLRADQAIGYGELMKVLNLLRGSGYLKVALVGLESSDGASP